MVMNKPGLFLFPVSIFTLSLTICLKILGNVWHLQWGFQV